MLKSRRYLVYLYASLLMEPNLLILMPFLGSWTQVQQIIWSVPLHFFTSINSQVSYSVALPNEDVALDAQAEPLKLPSLLFSKTFFVFFHFLLISSQLKKLLKSPTVVSCFSLIFALSRPSNLDNNWHGWSKARCISFATKGNLFFTLSWSFKSLYSYYTFICFCNLQCWSFRSLALQVGTFTLFWSYFRQ